MKKRFLCTVIISLLTGCTSAVNKHTSVADNVVSFSCKNGETLQVRFYPTEESALLLRHGDEIKLEQQVSASGFIYSNGPNSIRGKGDNLTVEIGRMMPIECVVK